MRIGCFSAWLICLWKACICEANASFGLSYRVDFRGGNLDQDTSTTDVTSNANISNVTSNPEETTILTGGATTGNEIPQTAETKSTFKRETIPPIQSLSGVPRAFLKAWHHHLPRPFRFFISGRFGDIIFFYCEQFLNKGISTIIQSPSPSLPRQVVRVLETSQDSISFLIGFLLHILPQHWIHACLVYGLDTINTRQKYRDTLLGMYQVCLTGAVGSTILNTLLLKLTPASKTAAFIMTLATFSLINYFWIGWVVQKTTQNESPPSAPLP